MKSKLLLVVGLCFFILQSKAIKAPVASSPSGAAVQYGFSTYVQIGVLHDGFKRCLRWG